ncbi:hypothetical protein B0T16DRAFT_318383 [Cercophora newfieldiana]|uniref:Rhodopsin domain-containing protein n=1 Tax=Cercophora newfieldiana TaxID=92897 RepID=A0AA40D010_9PEZI|nr:hypothetical protein B0T16DRAFT_318383 [Cercophora newfieldiana]
MSDSPAPPANGTSPPPPPPPPPGFALPPDPATAPHDNLKANLYAAASICWFFAAMFVGLRFYTRGVIIRTLTVSDWCILLAVIFSAGETAALIDQTIHGSGSHLYDLDPTNTSAAMAWFRAAWYGVLTYHLSLFCSKLAILFLYIHIFAFKWARVAGQVLLVIVVIGNIFMIVTTLTACIPLRAYWDMFMPRDGVYCHPQSFWWANTGMHMVQDVLIFLLPMPVVWGITLPLRQKIMLFLVFGCGFVVCFISILRLPKLYQNDMKSHDLTKYYDFTYEAVELSYLTSIEVNGAIVCACALTLKPFFAKFFPKALGSSESGSSSGANRNAAAAANNNMRGPPTIGSMPSKQPLSPAETELKGRIGGSRGGSNSSGRRSNAWLDTSRGYVEIDEWEVDVEMAEGKDFKKDIKDASDSSERESSTERKNDKESVTTGAEVGPGKEDQ